MANKLNQIDLRLKTKVCNIFEKALERMLFWYHTGSGAGSQKNLSTNLKLDLGSDLSQKLW